MMEEEPKRPLGISILMVLHMVGGAALLAVTFSAFIPLVTQVLNLKGRPDLETIRPLLILAPLGMVFLGILGTVSGVGFALGTRWGWWLGTFYYVYVIFLCISALLNVFGIADQLTEGQHSAGFYYAKYGGRLISHSLILLYFFKSNVLEYFDVTNLNRKKALWQMVEICLAIGGAVSLIMLFL